MRKTKDIPPPEPRTTPQCSRPVTPKIKPINEKEQLFIDIRRHNLDGLEQLLERGPELDRIDETYGVPIIYATENNNLEAIHKLLDFGADVNFNYNGTVLHACVKNKNMEILNFLLENGADVTQLNNQGENPLFEAVRGGDLSFVERLIESGAPVNIMNHNKRTPLSLAIESRNEVLVKYLLSHGADANGPGKNTLKLARKLQTNFESVLVMNGAKEKVKRPHNSRQQQRGKQNRMETIDARNAAEAVKEEGQCQICEATENLMKLIPCEHTMVCEKCVGVFCDRMDRCPKCKLSFLATKKA